MTTRLVRVWNAVASLVFVLALWVAVAQVTGYLDPVGSAYYGVVVSWRTEVLLTLLVALEAVCIVDAFVLGWRRRRRTWWALLSVAVLTLPFSLVLAMARLDLWCYDRRSASARLIAGALMVALIGGAQLLRLWAWRITEPK